MTIDTNPEMTSLALQDMAEHLTTVYLSRCERGRRCLYEGSTPPGGFPNSWVTSESPVNLLKIPWMYCLLFWNKRMVV